MKTTEELVEAFKKDVFANITKHISRNGGLSPIVLILAREIESKDLALMVCPLPGDIIDDEHDLKDSLRTILPKVFDGIFAQGLEPICYSWSSEAWLRAADIEDGEPENWKDLPKVEVLMTTFETVDSTSVEINIIKRDGKIADEDGNLIDCITLEKHPEFESKDSNMGGRLANIFKNYMQERRAKSEKEEK